ncbi:protodermal factor 1-like, partial [Asparagus officinalis]|uniref:protodermal factor 1-like n=1 Tax=Asparagus officinalis TaxID=4686 RepID=UPI00098DEC9A
VKPTPSRTPSTPSHGGGYYPSPSSHPTPVKPSPSTPIITPPVTPTPTVPVTPTPTTPVTPTPSIPDPSTVPPFAPGSCSYWTSHPDAIWSVVGYWGSISKSFGAACSAAFGGKNLSLHDALTNPRTDGIGALYREGTCLI